MASRKQLDDRFKFLADTLGDRREAKVEYERIVEGNELQPINYLQHGTVAGRSVCRIAFKVDNQSAFATGFLIAPGVLVTNNHVFPAAAAARDARAEFDLELDIFDNPKQPVSFRLQPDRLFMTSSALDYSIVSVEDRSEDGVALSSFGYLPLVGTVGKVADGEWLTIIQHPGGQEKQVCIRENKLLTRTDDVLWYSTDTLGGSSGSPVFNNSWDVVALHHKGVPLMKNGIMQTIDDRDFDPGRDKEEAIKWIANEGIRVSRLVADLKSAVPDEPLFEPIFNMEPDRARAIIAGFARAYFATAVSSGPGSKATPPIVLSPLSARESKTMANRSINLTFDIDDDGSLSLRQPGARSAESFVEATSAASADEADTGSRPADYDVPFDPDYSPTGKRKGYDPAFLGKGNEVLLPTLGTALQREATPLLDHPKEHVLNYFGYSLVMHAERKFAIYTAANVDGSHRHKLGRPHDQWRFDPRIARSSQIAAYYYEHNKFDRGHLTRYEDMQYGANPTAALECAADTLHWSNCAPQHARFNENRQLWAGLEMHILEGAIRAKEFRAQVFTGPVLDDGDPVWKRYKDIKYPLRFWKIATALSLDSKGKEKLFAAAFLLDQSEVIEKYGIEATVEVPFTAFKTFQVPIAEIERLTGLAFTAGANGAKRLSEFDPLATASATRREAIARARVSSAESTSAEARTPPGYVMLANEADIVRD